MNPVAPGHSVRALCIATALSLLVLCALPAERARAGAATGGSTEITQVGNWAQLLDQSFRLMSQTKNMKQRLELMQTSGKALGQGDLSALFSVVSVAQQVSQLFFQCRNLSSRYRTRYPGYETRTAGPRGTVNKLERENRIVLEEAIESIDLQVNDPTVGMPADEQVRQALLAKSQSAVGLMQATQVSHALLAELIRQMQLMRGAFLSYHQMTAFLEASKVEKKQEEQFNRKQKVRVWAPADTSRDWTGAQAW